MLPECDARLRLLATMIREYDVMDHTTPSALCVQPSGFSPWIPICVCFPLAL
jgi:hypothetical protein